MAARLAAKFFSLVFAVLLVHGIALHWLGNQWRAMDSLKAMPEAMFTRTLEPEEPAAGPKPKKTKPRKQEPAQPRAVISVQSQSTPTQAITRAPEPEPATPGAAATPTLAAVVASITVPLAPELATATATLGAAATSSLTATSADLSTWPPDTRLRYRLTGYYRGDIGGSAKVMWQRVDTRYQVEVELSLGIGAFTMTSQGLVTPEHLRPEIYVESLLGKRQPINFGEEFMTMSNGSKEPRPALVQDTASQYIELSRRFSQVPGSLQPGAIAPVTMARPGGVDAWQYEVFAPEMLTLMLNDKARQVEAYKLSPKPLPNREGYIFQEIWYAPSLGYLPVRIRIDLGEHKGHVMLDVIAVEQK